MVAVPIGGYWYSMVIRDFNVRGVVVVGPDKAQAELIIDADGMLAAARALQGFQAVPHGKTWGLRRSFRLVAAASMVSLRMATLAMGANFLVEPVSNKACVSLHL